SRYGLNSSAAVARAATRLSSICSMPSSARPCSASAQPRHVRPCAQKDETLARYTARSTLRSAAALSVRREETPVAWHHIATQRPWYKGEQFPELSSALRH